MIGDPKPYPSMRESGLPWVAKIPAHWRVVRTKYLMRETDERSKDGSETQLSMSQKHGLIESSKIEAWRMQSESHVGGKLCKTNDLVLNRLKAHLGVFAHASQDGLVSPDYTVLRLIRDDEVRFFELLLKTPEYIGKLRSSTKGIVEGFWRLYTDDFYAIKVVVPPVGEQRAILRWIDLVDRRIRSYIRAKQKLVKLLEEQKQAIIHGTVTGGVDPNARLTPSGIEWLGCVPAHWTVMPLKRAFSSMDYGISESGSDDGRIRLLSMGDIRNGNVTVPESGGVHTVDDALLLQPGDLLFNRTNSAELVGKVGLFLGAATPITFASYLVRLRPKPQNVPEYLNYLLNDRHFLQRVRREAIPSLHQSNLNPTRYGRFSIPLPPRDEQLSIVQDLKNETTAINIALDKAGREIRLLQALLLRLVADVVTGKRDVREASKAIPPEIQEPVSTAGMDELTEEDEGAIAADVEEAAEEAEA